MLPIWRSFLVVVALCASSGAAYAGHAFALGYKPKYAAGFDHFDYVNPAAPRTGEVVLSAVGNFDSLNPYILRAVPATGLGELMFEGLTEASSDEPITRYGLLADDMTLADDQLSVTYHINPKARFSDGSPVTADDVKYSFDTLTSKLAHPQFAFYWGDIKRCVVMGPSTVRFDFARKNAELHLITGEMPIFSRRWGAGKPFDKLATDPPIASGPYLIETYDLGKRIVYRRNPAYWGKDLNVRRGTFNFERVIYRYYKDTSVRLEAFKAGEFEFILENSAKKWAKEYSGEKFDQGNIKKSEFANQNGAGMQGFVINTRRPSLSDRRVRRAIGAALDFDWCNRKLFFNQYTRDDSYFTNSELASRGLPEGEELSVLEPFRAQLPKAIFDSVWRPWSTVPPQSLRENLRAAKRLLEEAGWRIKDGVLSNEQGQTLQFEIMVNDKAFERIVAPFSRNLEKLGIRAESRLVDAALYKRRLERFEFDMAVESFGASQNPGNELVTRFSSKAAAEEGSENTIGVKDPVVDALIEQILTYDTRHQLIARARALDRVLLHGEYVVPNWYIAYHRVAYHDRFGYPERLPLYYGAEAWMLQTWWRKGGH